MFITTSQREMGHRWWCLFMEGGGGARGWGGGGGGGGGWRIMVTLLFVYKLFYKLGCTLIRRHDVTRI